MDRSRAVERRRARREGKREEEGGRSGNVAGRELACNVQHQQRLLSSPRLRPLRHSPPILSLYRSRLLWHARRVCLFSPVAASLSFGERPTACRRASSTCSSMRAASSRGREGREDESASERERAEGMEGEDRWNKRAGAEGGRESQRARARETTGVRSQHGVGHREQSRVEQGGGGRPC